MEEVKRSKSNVHSKQKIPVYPNGRSSSLRPANSNVSLSPLQGGSFLGSGMTSSSTALNNSLAQGVISAQIGSQAQELLKIRELQQKYQSVSPYRENAASYQGGKSGKSHVKCAL